MFLDSRTAFGHLFHPHRIAAGQLCKFRQIKLARGLGTKTVAPCAPEVADRHSGYQVGGTSPFGLRRAMPIYLERTILALPRIYINGGARGFLVELDPAELARVLAPVLVDVAVA